MRSASEPRRLATRVVRSTMLAGALAGALAALSAVLGVDHLIARHARQRVAGAADVLAGELDEGFEENEWEPLGEIVQDENGELVTSGIRLAVYSGRHRIAGDPWAPWVAPGECATSGPLGARVLACGRAYRGWVLVGATRSDDGALGAIYAVAGLGSLALGALIAALAARRLSRWALEPLSALTRAIGALDLDARAAAPLGPASPCEEVELIRRALLELHARASALLDQARRFSADAAHELRTPLAAIRAEVELLLEDARAGGQGAAHAEALARIGRRVRELGELVERLLALSSTLGAAEVSAETLSLAELTAEAVAALEPPRRARVALHAPTEALVRGDSRLLRALIGNALDNALKFSGDAPVTVELEELELSGARWVSFEARDHGPGVPEALRARVFEPFFRAEPSRAPGHGLGLALIGHIARAHGGRAELLDVPPGPPQERGARLRVLLPAWRPRDPNAS